jgi:hypothetical protein
VGTTYVDLRKYFVKGENNLKAWVTHGTGEGSPVSVRIKLEIEE